MQPPPVSDYMLAGIDTAKAGMRAALREITDIFNVVAAGRKVPCDADFIPCFSFPRIIDLNVPHDKPSTDSADQFVAIIKYATTLHMWCCNISDRTQLAEMLRFCIVTRSYLVRLLIMVHTYAACVVHMIASMNDVYDAAEGVRLRVLVAVSPPEVARTAALQLQQHIAATMVLLQSSGRTTITNQFEYDDVLQSVTVFEELGAMCTGLADNHLAHLLVKHYCHIASWRTIGLYTSVNSKGFITLAHMPDSIDNLMMLSNLNI